MVTPPAWSKFRIAAICLLGTAWLALVVPALVRLQSNIEDVGPWLPDDTPQRREYEWFVDTFGSDDSIIVSWDGCRLEDPRVAELTTALRTQESRDIREVVSPTEALEEIVEHARVPRETAIERLQGFLVGPDGQTCCLLLYLTEEGMQNRRRAVHSVIEQSLAVGDLKPHELHLGGRPYLGYYTSGLTHESMVQLSIPVVVLSTLLAWLSLGDLTVLALTLGSSGVAALTALAMIPWFGYELSGLLSALPSLIYVLATSGTIHLVNYAAEIEREATVTAMPFDRAAAILQRAVRPCLLSSASTALGTLSLLWSEFPAIREFGLFGTIGVGIMFAVHVLLMPRLLAWRFASRPLATRQRLLPRRLDRLLEFIIRHRRLVIAGALLVTALLAARLPRLQAHFEISKLFTSDSEFLQHAHWLEQNIGPTDATHLVLEFAPDPPGGRLNRIQQVQQLEQAIGRIEPIDATYSAATLLPDMSRQTSVLGRMFARAAIQRRSDELTAGNLIVETPQAEYWQIAVRTSLFADIDRHRLRDEIVQTVDEVSKTWDERPGVLVTGATQLFEESKDHVLGDFIESLLLAYGLILVLIVISLRSLIGGLLAMIPNVIPNIVVFGGLAWIDGAIDMGMTVAACIALGIAVDDTSHLIMSYRDHRRSASRHDALRTSFRECGPAMCQTTLICGVAMLPYLWAELLYLSRFGLVIPLLMVAALVGDLLLLPALMAGRGGRWFDVGRPFNPEPSD